MKTPATARVVISEHVLAQEVGGETVLLDFRSERYFALDAVGTRVWQLLGQGQTPAAVVDTLLGEYAVERTRLAADVSELLGRLEAAGLIHQQSDGADG